MSLNGTLKEIVSHNAKKQAKLVDTLTEKAPMLDVIPFAPSSHGLWNVFEETRDIQGAAFVPMNSPLGEVELTTDIKKTDMDIMGGKIYVPEDQAKMMGGQAAYFAKKLPKILSKAGMDTERRFYYGSFIPYAVQNGSAVDAGGTGSHTASIVAVRFETEVTSGLYSPEGFNKGEMLDVTQLNGGQLHTIPSGKFAGVEGYGMRLKGYFGIQIADPRTVGAILNITTANIPTAAMIDDLLADVRADKRDTFLFMHVKTKNLLNAYKQDSLHMTPEGNSYRTSFQDWDGIPIITSYNILPFGETAVTI